MSFQAHLDKVETLTGLSIVAFEAHAETAGLIQDDRLETAVRATRVTDRLTSEFGLGHGQPMLAYAWSTGKRS